jgi:hypothetical protein
MDLTKLKIAFSFFAMVIFGLFVASLIQDGDREWKGWQEKFYAMEKGRGVSRDYSQNIKQIYLEHQGRTDRCITCHLGMADVDVSNEYTANPFRSHPDTAFLKMHRPDKFGCVVCHDGQGLGTTTAGAHGHVKSWDFPMLMGADIQASCSRCHGWVEPGKFDFDAMPAQGTEWVAVGRALVNKYGCLGCHTIQQLPENSFAKVGPELSNVGSATDAEWGNHHHFNHVTGERTKRNWIYQHFLDPLKVTPGDPVTHEAATIMPNFHMTPTMAKALTIFVMSLRNQEAEALPSNWMAKAVPASYSVSKR